MYTRYFGFNEKPFTLTPNPRFIFLSKHHKEAFAHILYGLNGHHGFIELIGEVGTGKTTVLRTMLGQLQDGNHRFALIFNPCMTSVELLQSINQEFGIKTGGDGINDLLNGLNCFLLEEKRNGRTVVLVIDEAQNLQPEVLEQLRLISNLETESDKLIQIILAGQPELENSLRRHNLRQLNQRIAVRYRLKAMNIEETGAYIRHRLEIAGAEAGVSFSNLAIFLIHLYSRGVPRMINIICDRALLTAYGDGSRKVSLPIVLRTMNEFNAVFRKRLIFTSSIIALFILMVMLGLLSVGHRFHDYLLISHHNLQERVNLQWPKTARKPSTVGISLPPSPLVLAAGASVSPETFQKVKPLEQALLNHGLNNTHISAFNGLMARWNARPIRIFKGTLSVPTTFESLATKRNLRCTIFHGSLDDAIRFDIPFLASTRVVDKKEHFYLAVTSAKGELLSVSPPLLDKREIKRGDFAHLTDGTFYLLWRDSSHMPDSIAPRERLKGLRKLQQLLTEAGYYQQAVDGEYNAATIRAVRQFQISLGIPANDSGGELTLALLSKYDTTHKTPSLTRE